MLTNTNQEVNYPLASLLPYKLALRNADVSKGLKEYHLLLKSALNTSQALTEGNYSLFDALVGENFCQARAIRVILSARQCRISFQQKKQALQKALHSIECDFANKDNIWYKKNALSFQSLLEEHLGIALTKDELFFVQAYLLTVVKTVNHSENYFKRTEKTASLNLGQQLTKKFREDLVSALRFNLASDSIAFIRELATRSYYPHVFEKLAEKNIAVYNKLPALPFFAATQVLLEKAAEQNIPLVLIAEQMTEDKTRLVRQIAFFYEVCRPASWLSKELKPSYLLKNPSLSELGKPLLVVKGVMCGNREALPNKEKATQKIRNFNPIDLILATSAKHRQYPDPARTVEQDVELEQYAAAAEQWGCSIENASLFTTFHMYSDKLENIESFKYILNQHLLKYHAFYREQCVKGILSFLSADVKYSFNADQSKVTFAPVSSDELLVFSKLKKYNYFMINPQVSLSQDMAEVNLQIDDSKDLDSGNIFYVDILKCAQAFSDPSQFLLDHRLYWKYRISSIVKFLISIPDNKNNAELLEFCVDFLKESGAFDTELKKIVFDGIGNALKGESLYAKAKIFITEFDCLFDSEIRQYAWQQLMPFLADVDIQTFFEKIAAEEKLPSLKFAAVSYLDQAILDKVEFEEALFQLLDLSCETAATYSNLEKFLLWLYTVTKTNSSYENLKDPKYSLKLQQYLANLCKTSLPFKIESKYFIGEINAVNLSAAIGERLGVSLGFIERAWEKQRIAALIKIFLNEEGTFKKSWRLLALRNCAPYFFYEPEPGWTEQMHEIFKARNVEHAKEIYPHLQKLDAIEEDPYVKEEVEQLLSLLASNP